MKILNKVLIFFIILIVISRLYNTQTSAYSNSKSPIRKPIKVAVFLYKIDDQYLSLVKQNLENIQKQNSNKVEFTFFDGKENQTIQNQSVDDALKQKYDLIILNLADSRIELVKDIINKIIQKNIPLILYSDSSPQIINLVKANNNSIIIETDAEQSGALEGKIIVDAWNSNKASIDKNGDNKLQYIMLHGKINSQVADARTKYSISVLAVS